MYYATSLGGAWTTAFEPGYGVDALSCSSSSFCIDGQGESGGYIRYATSPGSTSWTAEDIAGSTNVNGVFCLSSTFCTAVDSVGDVHVADSTSQIESESWASTDIDGTTALHGVACTSTTSCVSGRWRRQCHQSRDLGQHRHCLQARHRRHKRSDCDHLPDELDLCRRRQPRQRVRFWQWWRKLE